MRLKPAVGVCEVIVEKLQNKNPNRKPLAVNIRHRQTGGKHSHTFYPPSSEAKPTIQPKIYQQK